jgi:hypothetical protein
VKLQAAVDAGRKSKKARQSQAFHFLVFASPEGLVVGRGRLELPTNGLKVRCSTD